MTTIYLINNSLTLNNLNFPSDNTLEMRREKRILSIEGEKESAKLVNDEDLKHVDVIFVSPYVMSIESAKYLAKSLDLDLNIRSDIGEAKIGDLGEKKIRLIREMQENNFSYKLVGGESLNDVKKRMLNFLKKVLTKYKDKNIAIFTHNVAITSLLSEYCTKGYNLDNRLILNYNEESIVDGSWNGIQIIEMKFKADELISIKRKK